MNSESYIMNNAVFITCINNRVVAMTARATAGGRWRLMVVKRFTND